MGFFISVFWVGVWIVEPELEPQCFSVDTQLSKVLYICGPYVHHYFPVERLKAKAKLWMFYGISEDVRKDRNGEEKVYDDWVDNQG